MQHSQQSHVAIGMSLCRSIPTVACWESNLAINVTSVSRSHWWRLPIDGSELG